MADKKPSQDPGPELDGGKPRDVGENQQTSFTPDDAQFADGEFADLKRVKARLLDSEPTDCKAADGERPDGDCAESRGT